MDTHQAIYDAVRSRIGSVDVGEAIRSAVHIDGSWAIESVKAEFLNVAFEMQSPAAIYRPKLSIEGSQWCALYGDDLQSGVAGFGDSPALAMTDFNRAWSEKIDQQAGKGGGE